MSGLDYEQLTLFQEASHASHLVWPGSEEARTMTATSGRKCLELYRKSGPLGSLVRMLVGSSEWVSTRRYLTWKPQATKRGRLYFRLVPLTPPTDVIDARLLHTPTRFDADCGDLKGKEFTGTRHAMKLIQAVKMWPTPKATDCKGSGRRGSKAAEHDLARGNLKGVVMYRDHGDVGQLNPDWVEWLMAFPPGWTDIG